MCGITAYCGRSNALPFLLRGLEKLEYRGYDSSGISLLDNSKIMTEKKQGRLKVLEDVVAPLQLYGTSGIAHTRWATHGEPSDVNAHPHNNPENTISIVHNGIIENADELKADLKAQGYVFKSQTDTEVIVALLDYYYTGNPLQALQQTIARLKGSYALACLFADHSDTVYTARLNSPLILGQGPNRTMAASDIPALLGNVDHFYLLDDHQLACMTPDHITIYNENLEETQAQPVNFNIDAEVISKGGFPTFMEKEIHEQPFALQQTLGENIQDNKVVLEALSDIKEVSGVYLFACGTAYHACLVASSYFEQLTDIPCVTKTASEFRYSALHLPENSLAIFVSQSGETADTLAACKMAQQQGALTLAITNVVSSSLARICDRVLYTKAGIEIAVASTKAYTTQVLLLLLVALHFSKAEHPDLLEDIQKLPHLVDLTLNGKEDFEDCVRFFEKATSAFYIGRQLDYTSAMEGALKIKEIAYIHAEAFAAGELKHGPIALVDETTPVIALATQKEVLEKTLSNVEETISRKAHAILLTESDHIESKEQLHVIRLPKTHPLLYPIIAIVPLQILACRLATVRHHDVDKPRNLAKSVTVE